MIAAAVLVAATLLVYAQVCRFDFIGIDDPAYVPANAHVQLGTTLQSLVWSFTTVHDCNWIPFTWISLMLDADIYGLHAGGYHFTNVLLHAASTVLLFLALSRATGNWARSAFVAALFALHPLHVESVAWVAERKDVLSTFFGLLSLLTYVRYATGAGRWSLAASFGFFIASLLSKQTLVTLPFVFLLLDFWPLGRWSVEHSQAAMPSQKHPGTTPIAAEHEQPIRPLWHRSALRLIAEKIPFFAASAVFSLVAMTAQSLGGAAATLERLPLVDRCTNAIIVYCLYLEKTLLPQNLAIYYPHPAVFYPQEARSWVAVGLAAMLLAAITITAVLCIRRAPFLFVGWFWYVGTLVPMIGLVQIGAQQMADRYTYFPLIGVFLAGTWLVCERVPAGIWRARLLPAAALSCLLLMGATAFEQIGYWHDSLTLLRHSSECARENAATHEYLGSAYLEKQKPAEAVQELAQAVRTAPIVKPGLHRKLGTALQRLGRLDDAAREYREAILLGEPSPDVHVDLGVILCQRGHLDDGAAQYRKALEIDPDFAAAHGNLGIVCLQSGDNAGAIAHSERALTRDPDMATCHLTIAIALRSQGDLDDAIRHFERALEIDPNQPLARDELARTQVLRASSR